MNELHLALRPLMNFIHTNTILMATNLKPPFSPVEPCTISQILWYVGCPRRTGRAIGIGKRDRNPCYSPQDNQHGMFSHVVTWPTQRLITKERKSTPLFTGAADNGQRRLSHWRRAARQPKCLHPGVQLVQKPFQIVDNWFSKLVFCGTQILLGNQSPSSLPAIAKMNISTICKICTF